MTASFRRAVETLGLELGRPYDLRHSFASLLLRETGDLVYVAEQLGHGVGVLASTYSHGVKELRLHDLL